MKKVVTILISVCLLLTAIQLKAQVKIGDNPTTIGASSILELEKGDKALVVTRVDNVMVITNPVNGMIVYDNSSKCFRVYQGGVGETDGAWSDCYGVPITPLQPKVLGLGCANALASPTSALKNVYYNGSVTLPYYMGNGAVYPTQSIASTGVEGLTAQLLAGTLNGAPAAPADGDLHFTISGTPTSTGNANFAFSFGEHSCIFSISVNYPAAVASTNCAGKVITGTLKAGEAASSVSVSVPYTSGNGGYYNAISISSVGVVGLLANAPAGFVAMGDDSLTLNITGTPNTAGNALFNLNFAGTSCQLSILVIPGGPVVSAFNCSSTTFSPGTIYSGTPYSGTATIPYTGGNGQAYAAGAGVPSTGVTGLTATLQAGTLANGGGNLTYAISGTPNTSGTASFSLSFGGQTCNLATTVAATPATLPAGTGTFTGKTCFDIARVNDSLNGCGTLTSRLAQQSDFSLPAVNTQSYTFTPTGAVSNVRFMYVNTNGDVITSVSGNNSALNITVPVIATVNYNTDLNNLAQGITNSNPLTANIYAVYNDKGDGTGVDRQLKLTAQVKDCACCGAYIAPGVWKNFMCHNLGADPTADPFTPSWKLNGAYILWGSRGPNTTGNSVVDWQTAPNNGPMGFRGAPTGGSAAECNCSNIPNWANYVNSFGWRATTKTIDDPCPAGFRIPTNQDWNGVKTYNKATIVGTVDYSCVNYGCYMKLGDALFLPGTGSVDKENCERGNAGWYHSATRGTDYWNYPNVSFDARYVFTWAAMFLYFPMLTEETEYPALRPRSVRCIAE